MRCSLGWLTLAALCCGAALAQTVPAPTLEGDYFTREVKPLNVTPSTDADNSYSDVIGSDGGQLTTLDAAGNTYTLTVPKGALGYPERLTMTPLTALKGMPFKGGVNAGVQLEPDGTFFVQPVTLEVEFAKTPDLKTITPFNYTGAGQDFTTTMLMHDPGHYVFLLNHFSGAGFANSNEAERTAELVRQPLADEERIQHYVQEQLGAERQRQLLGQESDDSGMVAVSKVLGTEYEKQVIEPLKEASTKSCTVGVLYIQKLLALERMRQLLGADSDSAMGAVANALGGPIQKKCLEEEAQVCYKTGDLLRFATWYMGLERQRQLLGASLENGELDADFQKDYNACAHFEVQFNSTLTQKSDVDTSQDTGGDIQVKGKINYSATITSILPIKATIAGGVNGILAGTGLPRGDQPLPYAGYSMTYTANGAVALGQTNNGAFGITGNCAESGTGTTPGQIAAQFIPIFKPGDKNAPDPALDGLSPAQKRDVTRVLHNTPRYGLLAPPRELDLSETKLYVGVGNPTEHTSSTCNEAHTHKQADFTTWLDAWNKELKTIGKGATVPLGSGMASEPGWELNKWEHPKTSSPKLVTFPLKIVQDVPKHEAISGSTYDEVWHLDITVVHTPKE